MDNGIYITLSRQMALFRDMDTTAGNIANANTTGFQSSHLMFDTYLADAGNKDKMAYANDVSTYRDTQQGAMRATGNDLDVAIQGKGYFAVETPQGERYTRSGNFQIDGTGVLVTQDGLPVMDQNNQRIIIPENAKSIVIGSIGNITVNGEELTNIGVFNFENEQALRQTGSQLYSTEETPSAAIDAKVAQGMLENSNVQPVLELTHMIDVSRAVGGTAKYIEMMYDLQRKTGTAWTQQA